VVKKIWTSLAMILLGAVAGPQISHAQIQFYTDNVTRAEAAMLLLKTRAAEVKPEQVTKAITDVIPNSWYERFVAKSVRFGLMDPDSTGRVRPDQAITRAEFITMLTIAFDLPEGLPHTYEDVLPTWYARYVGTAQQYQLFQSDIDRRRLFFPQRQVSHDEALAAVQRLQRTVGQFLPKLEVDASINLRLLARKQAAQAVLDKKFWQSIMVVPAADPLRAKLTTAVSSSSVPSITPTEAKTQVIALVNAERTARGLHALQSQRQLTDSAQKYSEDMVAGNFFSHVAPDGQTLEDRMKAAGYYGSVRPETCNCVVRYIMGENLAQGQKTPADVVLAWMRSPLHRQAILSPQFTNIGVGIKDDTWTQHFGGVLATVQRK
jgi:uncharacterized protein YkwD